ncbi:hemolysin family protein [Selenomonadales bacterium OttesenSCG-928-I06]|nr:hemolysin family protein [Selenomonadales bacterium OttesenSCG-928-I06]
MYDILKILAAFFLVLLNGFFVVAEFSIVKIRKTRLEELAKEGNQSASLALKIVNSLDTYLSAVQLGITLSSLGLGWLGEPAIAAVIRPTLEPVIMTYFPGNTWLISSVSIAIGFTIITLMHVVIGELIPKTLAIVKTEKMALTIAFPLYIFHKIGAPIIYIFDKTASFLLRLMGISSSTESEAHSEKELRMLVSASHKDGVLDEMETEMIDNVFDFTDRIAREVMVPRQDMICLYTEDSFEENMEVVKQTGHTRYPLCQDDKDHILGMIHLRDLIGALFSEDESYKDLTSIVREILVIPEGMPVSQLMQVMRMKRTHLAVVADEYGGTAGLVAFEDLIEEIVGDIKDEHDQELENQEIEELEDGSYEFDGIVLMDDVIDLLDLDIDDHDEDTIGGYIFGMLGRKPEVADEVIIDNYVFVILEVNGYRVVRVKASLMEIPDNENPENT